MKGRTKSRWGPPKAMCERGDGLDSLARTLKAVMGETKGRLNKDGTPRHCWHCGDESHMRAECPKAPKKK